VQDVRVRDSTVKRDDSSKDVWGWVECGKAVPAERKGRDKREATSGMMRCKQRWREGQMQVDNIRRREDDSATADNSKCKKGIWRIYDSKTLNSIGKKPTAHGRKPCAESRSKEYTLQLRRVGENPPRLAQPQTLAKKHHRHATKPQMNGRARPRSSFRQ
jgi:hypothetical protein